MISHQPGDRVTYFQITGRGSVEKKWATFIREQIVGAKQRLMCVIELDEGSKRVRQVSPLALSSPKEKS